MGISQDAFFSEAQAVAGTDTTVLSTNIIDAGLDADVGGVAGQNIVEVFVETKFTGLTSLTLSLQDIAASDGTPADLVKSKAIPLASLVVSKDPIFRFLEPPGRKQYLQMAYVIVGTGTAGAITAIRRPIRF